MISKTWYYRIWEKLGRGNVLKLSSIQTLCLGLQRYRQHLEKPKTLRSIHGSFTDARAWQDKLSTKLGFRLPVSRRLISQLVPGRKEVRSTEVDIVSSNPPQTLIARLVFSIRNFLRENPNLVIPSHRMRMPSTYLVVHQMMVLSIGRYQLINWKMAYLPLFHLQPCSPIILVYTVGFSTWVWPCRCTLRGMMIWWENWVTQESSRGVGGRSTLAYWPRFTLLSDYHYALLSFLNKILYLYCRLYINDDWWRVVWKTDSLAIQWLQSGAIIHEPHHQW